MFLENDTSGVFQRNIKPYNSLPTLEEKIKWLEDNLGSNSLLGSGHGRVVYKVSNNQVIKQAKSEFGIEQNKAEAELGRMVAAKEFVAKVYGVHPKFHYVVSELVGPLEQDSEFEALTGIDPLILFGFLMQWREYGYNTQKAKARFAVSYAKYFSKEVIEQQVSSKFITNLLTFLQQSDLNIEDVTRLEHWGETTNGKVVLLDYGYTNTMEMLEQSAIKTSHIKKFVAEMLG